MPSFVRLILAIVVGAFVGSLVNFSLIKIGGHLVPLPAGTHANTMEGLKAALPLFEARHFLFPFLAHALGTLAGAFVAALLVPARAAHAAWAVGGLFLLGGAANVLMLQAPAWFNAADLLLAYGPMAWLGLALARRVIPAQAG